MTTGLPYGIDRPCPSIRIQPGGGLSTCPLLPPGEGFGDIHRDDPRVLLNRMERWPACRLHADKRVGAYLLYADLGLFGSSFRHPCRWRVILTMLARRIGPLPTRLAPAEPAEINREVAGLLPGT